MSAKRMVKNASNIVAGEPDPRGRTTRSGKPVRTGGIGGQGGLAKGLERALQGAVGGKKRRRR